MDNGIIHVEEFDTFEQIQRFVSRWDHLVEQTTGCIFLTYDWCRVWWEYYGQGRQMKILLFWEQDQIVGLLPLFYEKIRIGFIPVTVMKLISSDFMRPVLGLPILWEYMTEVIKTFKLWLQKKHFIELVNLGPLSELYSDISSVCDVLHGNFNNQIAIIQTGKPQMCFPLPPTWQEYYDSIPKKMKHEYSRKRRKLNRLLGNSEDIELIVEYAIPENFDQYFEECYHMHQEHWKNLNRSGHFGDWPYSKEFHNEIGKIQLSKNRLRLMRVRAGDCVLGFKYAYSFGIHYVEYLQARNESEDLQKASPGELVFFEQVKNAIADGCLFIDSLMGDFQHKKHLGAKSLPVFNHFLIRKGIFSKVKYLLVKYYARMLNFIYYQLWFCRLAPKLKMSRGKLLNKWIRTNLFC